MKSGVKLAVFAARKHHSRCFTGFKRIVISPFQELVYLYILQLKALFMIKIDEQFIQKTSDLAKVSPRKRMNYNFHPQLDDLLQRMLNAMEPGTYIQPHKHENPDKTEVFYCLRGRFAVVEYNEEGEIVDHIVLDFSKGNYACEIPPRTWHSIVSLEPGSVAYEVKNGPYVPLNDKNFASWSPREGEEGCKAFLQSVIDRLKLV